MDERELDQKLEQLKTDILQESAQNMRVILESSVDKKLDLIIEAQQTMMETLAPKDRVEALEDEIVFLKQVIRAMSKDIAELKKAQ